MCILCVVVVDEVGSCSDCGGRSGCGGRNKGRDGVDVVAEERGHDLHDSLFSRSYLSWWLGAGRGNCAPTNRHERVNKLGWPQAPPFTP